MKIVIATMTSSEMRTNVIVMAFLSTFDLAHCERDPRHCILGSEVVA